MKTFLFGLCAALLLGSGPAVRACKYCEMMNADPESRRLSAQVGGQDFPLEGITSQFQGAPPPAVLSTPPPAASVATNATDLPATATHRAVLPPPVAPAVPVAPVAHAVPVAAKGVPSVAAVAPPDTSARWADAGLVGLVAAGGLFCWRTRRPTASSL